MEIVTAVSPEWGVAKVDVSILSGVRLLLKGASKDVFVGLVILVFSIAFPLTKLAILAYCLIVIGEPNRRGKVPVLRWVQKLAMYSMLDVVVIGLVLVILRQFPHQVEVQLHAGIVFFCISIFLSALASAETLRLYRTRRLHA